MKIIILLLIIIISIFIYTWYKLRKKIYLHTSLNLSLIKKYPLKHKEVILKTSDGIKINAWYIPVKNAKAVVILIHGYTAKNGGKAMMLSYADFLIKKGYSVFLPDLRSVGKSSGNKIFYGIKEWKDVETSYDYLKSLEENKNLKIGFFGISMGASTGIITAGKINKGDFVIASVPFEAYNLQFKDEMKKINISPAIFFPFLKVAANMEFGRDYGSLDPIKMVKKINKPILIFAAKYDQVINFQQAENLYKHANEPKSYWLANTQHDIFEEKPDEFEQRVLDFLELNK